MKLLKIAAALTALLTIANSYGMEPQIGLIKLDFSRHRLTELPDLIRSLPQVHSLKFWYNKPNKAALKELFTLCTQLQKLNLGACNLTTALPDNIGNLTRLRSLNLRLNNLNKEALKKLFSQLMLCSQLTHLNLGANCLTKLPGNIGKLTQLRLLDLMENFLSQTAIDHIRQLLPNAEIDVRYQISHPY